MDNHNNELRVLVAEVAAAYFSTSPVSVSEIPTVLKEIAVGLASVNHAVTPEQRTSKLSEVLPQVSRPRPEAIDLAEVLDEGARSEPLHSSPASASEVRRSVMADGLISFEDGRTYKTLKRHLTTRGLTPEEYRAKWGLPNDYPMVCEASRAKRSALAKQIGLGRRDGGVVRKAVPSQRSRAARAQA